MPAGLLDLIALYGRAKGKNQAQLNPYFGMDEEQANQMAGRQADIQNPYQQPNWLGRLSGNNANELNQGYITAKLLTNMRAGVEQQMQQQQMQQQFEQQKQLANYQNSLQKDIVTFTGNKKVEDARNEQARQGRALAGLGHYNGMPQVPEMLMSPEVAQEIALRQQLQYGNFNDKGLVAGIPAAQLEGARASGALQGGAGNTAALLEQLAGQQASNDLDIIRSPEYSTAKRRGSIAAAEAPALANYRALQQQVSPGELVNQPAYGGFQGWKGVGQQTTRQEMQMPPTVINGISYPSKETITQYNTTPGAIQPILSDEEIQALLQQMENSTAKPVRRLKSAKQHFYNDVIGY